MIGPMKLIFLYLSVLSLLFSLSSCGKKPKVKDSKSKEASTPSIAGARINALNDLNNAMTKNDLAALKRCLDKNPDIDVDEIIYPAGETLLTFAIKNDYREIRNFLIDEGVNLEKTNLLKETPLMVAVTAGQENSVKVLLDLKVDLEKKDNKGNTALHLALDNSNDRLSLLLIREGANIFTSDSKDRNALRIAQEKNVPESLNLIKSIMEMEHGSPDITMFRNILLSGDHHRLKNVLARYPRIATEKAYEFINPLGLLVGVKDEINAMRSAELLIQYEANVNGPEGVDQTPLIKATISRKRSFVNLYLSSKANPQLLDKDGKSALIHAVEANNADLVDLLIAYSAAEEYTFRRNGRRVTYKACDIAKKVGRTLGDNEAAKVTNKKIKEILDCGLFSRLF